MGHYKLHCTNKNGYYRCPVNESEPRAGDGVYTYFLFVAMVHLKAATLFGVAILSVNIEEGMPLFRRRADCPQAL